MVKTAIIGLMSGGVFICGFSAGFYIGPYLSDQRFTLDHVFMVSAIALTVAVFLIREILIKVWEE